MWFVQSRGVFQEKGVPLRLTVTPENTINILRPYYEIFPEAQLKDKTDKLYEFFMENRKPPIWVSSDHGLAAFGRQKLAHSSFLPFYFRVCAFSIQRTRLSWSLKQARCPAVSDSWQGFLPLKIVQPLRLKARSSFLYRSAMGLLDVWTRINELSLFFGR